MSPCGEDKTCSSNHPTRKRGRTLENRARNNGSGSSIRRDDNCVPLLPDDSCRSDEDAQQPSKRRNSSVGASPTYTSIDCQSSIKDERAIAAYFNAQAESRFVAGDYKKASLLIHRALSTIHHKPDPKGNRGAHATNVRVEPPSTCYIYQRMDFDEGLDTYDDIQPVGAAMTSSAVLGTLLFNAGLTMQHQGNAEGATQLYRQALSVILPEVASMDDQKDSVSELSIRTGGHDVVVPVLHRVALSEYRRGNLQDALTYYEMAHCYARRLKGSEDLSVGLTLNCLGVVSYHLSCDDGSRAISYFEDALAILMSELGSRSLIVATALNNLGRVWVQREDFGKAYQYYERSLRIRTELLGRDHLDTAASSFNAAQSLHQQGELDKAIDLYREFLRVATLRFERKDHRDIAVVLSGIAQILQEKKEYDEAHRLYVESIRVGRAALGDYHSEVSILYNRLGNFYFEQARFDEALKAYTEGLRIERRVFNKTHPNISTTLSNIAEIYRQQRDYARSIKLYRQALKLQRARHGNLSTEVAGTLSVIGLIHDQNGEFSLALSYLQQSLIIKRTLLGDSHLENASTLMHLGSLLYRRNMISAALHVFVEAHRIRAEKLGADDRDVSFSMYNVGLCLHLRGDYKQAVACYRETLRVECLVLGNEHRDVSVTYSKLGEALMADGDLEGAVHCFDNVLRIEKALQSTGVGEDATLMARTLNEVGDLHLRLGNVAAMMEAYSAVARLEGYSIDSVKVSPLLKIYAAGFHKAAAAA